VNGRPPRSIAERDYNIVYWTDLPKGGHFAALEQPEQFCTRYDILSQSPSIKKKNEHWYHSLRKC